MGKNNDWSEIRIRIRPEQKKKLKEVAFERGSTISSLVKSFIYNFLNNEQ